MLWLAIRVLSFFFFFNDPATTEIYTLSLHDALPIRPPANAPLVRPVAKPPIAAPPRPDRKSTRLNSSHLVISYAVFCLTKKNTTYLHIFFSKKKINKNRKN